ncbi:MAG: hypothetical protein APF81_05240 [Desulfosporosinus sp. BRH_c37]|nr:MAG: hypothetical protein APF81_05240 [Desulfosporosinus sp. BRH_c37]
MDNFIKRKIIENFIELYKKYDINSDKLLKSIQEYYGKNEKDYLEFKNVLKELYLQDGRIYNELFKHIPLDQGKNHNTIFKVYCLIKLFDNIKPFVLDSVLSKKFDLYEYYGMNSEPFFNLNSQDEANKILTEFFTNNLEEYNINELYYQIFDDLKTIKDQHLLGKHTVLHFSYLKLLANIKTNQLDEQKYTKIKKWDILQIIQVVQKTISILGKRFEKLPVNYEKKITINMINKMLRNEIKLKIISLFIKYPNIDNNDLFSKVFADEIVHLVSDLYFTFLHNYKKFNYNNLSFKNTALINFNEKEGVKVFFTAHDETYIYSGDYYGECTASSVKKQVDPLTANIHWTVYSWIMNPFYRIIDVCYSKNGQIEKLLKGHIMPLIIHDRKVLMIDAIEVVPKLREYLRGNRNLDYDNKLYDMSKPLLLEKLWEALITKCKSLAILIGAESVYVEMFSNSEWIRGKIASLDTDSYYVNEVIVPFGEKPISANIVNFSDVKSENVLFEVQAKNLTLMEQQVRYGCKEVGVLVGRRENWRLNVKGI